MFVTVVTLRGEQIGYAEAEIFGQSRHAAMDSVSDDYLDDLALWVISTTERAA